MALYKDSTIVRPAATGLGAFDTEYSPGKEPPRSGIYRCTGCKKEISHNAGVALPPQNHHQHPQSTPIYLENGSVCTNKRLIFLPHKTPSCIRWGFLIPHSLSEALGLHTIIQTPFQFQAYVKMYSTSKRTSLSGSGSELSCM